MGSILGPNSVIAKDGKIRTYYCYVIKSMSRGNVLAQKSITHYHVQFGLQNKGRAIKGLVISYSWDLEPLYLLNGLALGCYQPSSLVYLVINKVYLDMLYLMIYWSVKCLKTNHQMVQKNEKKHAFLMSIADILVKDSFFLQARTGLGVKDKRKLTE